MVEQELPSRSSGGFVCSLLCSAELVLVDEWFVPLDYGKIKYDLQGKDMVSNSSCWNWDTMISCHGHVQNLPRCRQ